MKSEGERVVTTILVENDASMFGENTPNSLVRNDVLFQIVLKSGCWLFENWDLNQ